MSECEGGNAVPPMVNEDQGRVAVPPIDSEGEGKAAITPTVDDGHGMDPVSPVMSYEKGTDHLEPVISEGEIKYEGKGKSRSESFSHLPAHGDSAPSTAPSTRPVSQAQPDSAPSTAPSTRPVSQTQTESAPSTAPSTRPVSEAQSDSEKPCTAESTTPACPEQGPPVSIKAQDDPGPMTDQGEPAAITAQKESSHLTDQHDSTSAAAQSVPPDGPALGESTPVAAEGTLPPRNQRLQHKCGCADIYDHEGKKRQQACDLHRLNPIRSVLPVPPKKPLNEITNLSGGTRRTSVYTPQADRNEESPPEPPVVMPTKGRNFVQGSERGPTFLDPFNSDRAIEPTGPPDTLTTIPTQEDTAFKKLEEQAKAKQGGKAATEPKQSGSSEDNEDGGTRLSDEHRHQFKVREGKKPIGTASGPAFKKEVPQPKSILKKTVGTAAEVRQKERERLASGQVNNGVEFEDDRGGVRLFQETAVRLRAGEANRAANNAGGNVHRGQSGVPTPRLMLDTEAGPVPARTNSNGEPVFVPPSPPAYIARQAPRIRDNDSDKVGWCKPCGLM